MYIMSYFIMSTHSSWHVRAQIGDGGIRPGSGRAGTCTTVTQQTWRLTNMYELYAVIGEHKSPHRAREAPHAPQSGGTGGCRDQARAPTSATGSTAAALMPHTTPHIHQQLPHVRPIPKRPDHWLLDQDARGLRSRGPDPTPECRS